MIAPAYELTHDFDAADELGHNALRPRYGPATLIHVNESLAKLYMMVLAALLLLATVPNGSLLAASPGATEKTTPQGEDAPGPDDGTAVPPTVENKGVITPPPTGETGIHAQVPNPNAGTPEEVIPPPGTPGDNLDIQPR